jgi:CheY-like chemotaxis protein
MERYPGKPNRPMSVMLVDDNPTFLRILRRFLEEAGVPNLAVVATAGGGREALDLAAALRPALMVVDLLMPDLHGPELIHRLRCLLPGAGIIALTMLGAEVYRQAALAAGADDCVTRADLEHDLLPALFRVAQAQLPASDSVPLSGGSADAMRGSGHCHRVKGSEAALPARPADAPSPMSPQPPAPPFGATLQWGGTGRAAEPSRSRRPPWEMIPG